MNTKTCACHANSVYGVCDYPGGCGSSGGCCSTRPALTSTAKPATVPAVSERPSEPPTERRRLRAGGCPVCFTLRPDSDPRQPHNPPVCDGDRALLDTWLGEITRLHDQLTEPEQPIVDRRRHDRYATAYLPDGHRHTWNKGSYASDPVAVLGGVAPINSRSKAPSVSGSRERPIPINTDRHDLTSPARGANLTDAGRQHPEDHVGHLGAATILDGWVRSWRDHLWPGHHLPDSSVTELVKWLRTRLEDACDYYPIIDEFAWEIRNLRGSLRAAAGETDPQPERCDGVPCKRCDLMTLYRQPGGDVACVDPDCASVLREDEYLDWVKTLAAEQKIRRNKQRVA